MPAEVSSQRFTKAELHLVTLWWILVVVGLMASQSNAAFPRKLNLWHQSPTEGFCCLLERGFKLWNHVPTDDCQSFSWTATCRGRNWKRFVLNASNLTENNCGAAVSMSCGDTVPTSQHASLMNVNVGLKIKLKGYCRDKLKGVGPSDFL